MGYTYTYRKSDGEDIWTVGYEQDGKWIPESDWESEILAQRRVSVLHGGNEATYALNVIREKVEEMHEGYRKECPDHELSPKSHYHRGAADACANVLDLPEFQLFLPAKVTNG